MRLDLVLLSALAAIALGALIDSTRRAALGDGEAGEHDWTSGIVPRATIEDLERACARLDDAAARALIGLGVGGVTLGATTVALGVATIEIGAVLIAAGLGLALPGISWARDVHRDRAALAKRIARLRARMSRRERTHDLPLTRSGAESSPRRSAGLPRRS